MSLLDRVKGLGSDRHADGVGGDLALQGAGGAYAIGDERLSTHMASPVTPAASIITESQPSEMPVDMASPAMAARAATGDRGALPLIGHLTIEGQQKTLVAAVAAGLVGLVFIVFLSFDGASRSTGQVAAVGHALMESQRLLKSSSQAVGGDARAFAELRESADVLGNTVRGLQTGENGFDAAPARAASALAAVGPLAERASKNANILIAQEKTLTEAGNALRSINRRSGDMLASAESVQAQKLAQGAPTTEVAAASQLVMLTQRMAKGANEILMSDGASAEAVNTLGKDVATFREVSQGMLQGNAELRLSPTRDPQTREPLSKLVRQFEQMRAEASPVLSNLTGLAAVREAQASVAADGDALTQGLQSLQTELGQGIGFSALQGLALMGFAGLLGLGAVGLMRVQSSAEARRASMSEQHRMAAEREQHEAKRVNDANQAAILRLMNELQTVAEGDLTQQATVTEDITGAIADSVNYTVEELRTLVAQVQGTVGRVTETTQQVEATSTELLAASTEQLREIRDTGESVLQMAGRINGVFAQAQETAQVARQSRAAAESGLQAVQNTIGGMNSMREQIQETSKRIKRLGESSQEIGEITELISDITEQTNVLALNAAIQAASAGEAGRGFSVVAEEVQRLAERSGDATRQIAALVKTIQTDTQDAVAAMERSTQGVVESTRLSDAAGAALADIDRVSRELSGLIGRISDEARREAESANVVAANIQHIFAVTEQTGEGTRSTAQMVRELSRTAEELKQSVARFKIS